MNDNDVRADLGHSRPARSRLNRTLWLGGVLAALLGAFLLGSLVGPHALASSGHALWAGGHGCPIRGGHHGAHHSALRDPAQAREHARFAAEWVLRSVNATEDQKAQVGSIVERLADDLLALAPEHRENRQALLKALGDPRVDRDALERIREAEIHVVDRASTRLVEALGEVAGTHTFLRGVRLFLASSKPFPGRSVISSRRFAGRGPSWRQRTTAPRPSGSAI